MILVVADQMRIVAEQPCVHVLVNPGPDTPLIDDRVFTSCCRKLRIVCIGDLDTRPSGTCWICAIR